MSLLVYRGFSGPVTYVPTVGNPITLRDVIDATTNAIAGPVAKKSVLTSYIPSSPESHPTVPTLSSGLFRRHVFPNASRQRPCRQTRDQPQSTVCFHRRRCPSCRKQNVGLENIQRHQCGYLDCPSCHEYVHGETHRCFIQRAPKPQEKKKRKKKRQGGPRAKRGAAAGLETAPEEEDDVDDLPPCMCFLILKPCNPTNNTSPISSWPKPKTTTTPCVSPANIVFEIFSNGWIP